MKTISIDAHITEHQKLSLINYFYNCYYDTDQNISVFAPEFYNLVQKILFKEIPIQLNHLIDFEDGMLDCLNSKARKEALNKMNQS